MTAVIDKPFARGWMEISDPARLPAKPLLSVVVTAFNHGPYLAKAIESVLEQIASFQVELLINDDCSSDNTREIALKYQRRHPEVIRVLAGTANHVFRFTLEGKGLPDELVPKVQELKRRYDSSHHASPETAAHNAALVDELGLTAFLARQSTIAGPIGHCIERLHEVASAGVKGIIVAQFVPDQLNFMRTFADKVLPVFS